MAFTVDKKALTSALERCAKVAPSKGPLSILSHVALVSDGVELKYRATNLSITLAGSIDCSGLSASFTVNVRELLAAASSVIGDKVIETIGANEALGFMSMIDDNPRSSTARAREACGEH